MERLDVAESGQSGSGGPGGGSSSEVDPSDRARLGALTAGLVHNLNNMLAPIIMSVDLLRSGETDPERIELLDAIDEAATRAARTVREVSELARAGRGQRSRVVLTEVVRHVADLVRDTFPRRVDVMVGPLTDQLVVEIDPASLQALLVDRCLDSLEAMTDGGTLRITMERVDRAPEALASLVAPQIDPLPEVFAGPCALITIADSGPPRPAAITPDVLEGAAVATQPAGPRQSGDEPSTGFGSGTVVWVVVPLFDDAD